jgi:pimeloyl-ACP methyl ester carboxylesterase
VSPLVLVPGIGCGSEQFSRLRPGLTGFDVHPLELPGHRGAPALPVVSLDAVVDRIAEQVPSGSVVVGHSTGGIVGLVLAVRHPDLVTSLVILDSNLPVTAEALARKVSRADEVRGENWRVVLEDSMRNSWGPREPELREEVVAGILATPEAALRPLWFDVLALNPRQALSSLTMPTLYVRSSRDVDLEALSSLNPLITGVDLRERAPGHWPQLTEPGAVLAAVASFLV